MAAPETKKPGWQARLIRPRGKPNRGRIYNSRCFTNVMVPWICSWWLGINPSPSAGRKAIHVQDRTQRRRRPVHHGRTGQTATLHTRRGDHQEEPGAPTSTEPLRQPEEALSAAVAKAGSRRRVRPFSPLKRRHADPSPAAPAAATCSRLLLCFRSAAQHRQAAETRHAPQRVLLLCAEAVRHEVETARPYGSGRWLVPCPHRAGGCDPRAHAGAGSDVPPLPPLLSALCALQGSCGRCGHGACLPLTVPCGYLGSKRGTLGLTRYKPEFK